MYTQIVCIKQLYLPISVCVCTSLAKTLNPKHARTTATLYGTHHTKYIIIKRQWRRGEYYISLAIRRIEWCAPLARGVVCIVYIRYTPRALYTCVVDAVKQDVYPRNVRFKMS